MRVNARNNQPLATLIAVQNQREADKWRLADAATFGFRLSPFISFLIKLSGICKTAAVPFTEFEPANRTNVMSGDFQNEGQTDWAVLCSRKRNSSILVFWGALFAKFRNCTNHGH